MIACGWSHSLVICSNTTEASILYTWGKGDSGQLGLGDRMDRHEPTEILLESDYRTVDDASSRTIMPFQPCKVVCVAAGYFHTGLVVKDPDAPANSPTRVYTWGWGEHGQLGHGSVEDEVVPRVVSSLHNVNVTQMACGGAHTMLIDHNYECYGFGNTEFGQLGFTKGDNKPPPTEEEEEYGEQLNSTSEEIGSISGSDKICTVPTVVRIEDYTVLRVACGWWHTVAIVQNSAASI